jgi:hypothetical protein
VALGKWRVIITAAVRRVACARHGVLTEAVQGALAAIASASASSGRAVFEGFLHVGASHGRIRSRFSPSADSTFHAVDARDPCLMGRSAEARFLWLWR